VHNLKRISFNFCGVFLQFLQRLENKGKLSELTGGDQNMGGKYEIRGVYESDEVFSNQQPIFNVFCFFVNFCILSNFFVGKNRISLISKTRLYSIISVQIIVTTPFARTTYHFFRYSPPITLLIS
jgi:hypothetical protein